MSLGVNPSPYGKIALQVLSLTTLREVFPTIAGRRVTHLRHRRDKGVASARVVGDVALAGAAIAERFAQRRHMDPQGALLDSHIRPGPGDELLFRDRLAGVFDQRNQNIERSAADAQ